MAISNSVPVTIFQHARESRHPLGTVRLLKKGLTRCRVNTVEDNQVVENVQLENAWLLFPGEDALRPEDVPLERVKNLVVVDGTWRKARKMVYQSSWLGSLPRIRLSTQSSSLNYLRKSSVSEGVSTIEAVVNVLEALELSPAKYQPLIDTLAEMVKAQSEYIPSPILEKHYSGKMPVPGKNTN